MNNEYRICTRCVMDTSDPEIVFDENGICNHCKQALDKLNSYPFNLDINQKKQLLNNKIEQIKNRNKNKRYDCIIGLSGGVDSSYVAKLVKDFGLRPLAVHLDNGWDSELSVQNIENICKKLDIDLYTYVIDWEEFRDIQLAFLKASTPDSEIPSDHAIVSVLYKIASKERVKYIISGSNTASESILPKAWSNGHYDWKYIKSIHKKFGKGRIKSYPHMSLLGYIFRRFLLKYDWFIILDYLQYDKENAKKTIEKQLSWRNYGRKHAESNYTRIYQEYILPQKFGFDKRKAHLSSLIIAGQMDRDEALKILDEPLYPVPSKIDEDIDYLINKFGIDQEQFQKIMNAPPKKYSDYPNSSLLFSLLYKIALLLKKRKNNKSI